MTTAFQRNEKGKEEKKKKKITGFFNNVSQETENQKQPANTCPEGPINKRNEKKKQTQQKRKNCTID
jgi:hypothetical protein